MAVRYRRGHRHGAGAEPRLWVGHGVLEETRAAVFVDVDTRPAAEGMTAANLAAARLLAAELRLRNLGGGIVIDFAGLEGRGPRERIRAALTAALAADPAKPEALGWTRLGHLEVVRPRRGRSLSETMLEPALSGCGRRRSRLPMKRCSRCSARPAPGRRRIGGSSFRQRCRRRVQLHHSPGCAHSKPRSRPPHRNSCRADRRAGF